MIEPTQAIGNPAPGAPPAVAEPQQTNLETAQQFIGCLAGGGPVTFQTFDDAAPKRKYLTRIMHGTLAEHAGTLAQLNQQGAGIFIMINEGNLQGRKATDVTRVRAVFVDLDGAPLEPVLDCKLSPSIVVESSPGRFHAYWLCPGLSREQFKPVQQALAARFNGDVSVCDLPRVMRLPGFIHQKGAPFQTRIIK